jgi:hypothetical protein
MLRALKEGLNFEILQASIAEHDHWRNQACIREAGQGGTALGIHQGGVHTRRPARYVRRPEGKPEAQAMSAILEPASRGQLRDERQPHALRQPRIVKRPRTFRRLAVLLQVLLVSAASAQVFYSDDEFYRYLENRQRMAVLEAQARAWAREQAREQALYKPIPIDEELAAEVDEVLNQRVREAVQWLKTHPDR